jgi:hypothetical protein
MAERVRSARGDNGDWQPPQRNVIVTYRAGEYQRMTAHKCSKPQSIEEGWRYMHGKLVDTFDAKPLDQVQQFPMWCITAKKDERGLYRPGFGAPHAIEAIPWATRDPLKDGDILSKGNNPNLDRLDSLRYGVASYELSNDKPVEVRRQERTAQVPVEGTGRLTTGWAFDLEEKPKTQPFYNGGGQHFSNRWQHRRRH